ncbi:MAG: hypothetical protein GXO61_00510 [Epsilonproteobacteria bacterium]|nr:hypothetical protein [Campylobacterota bacterium]
MENFIAKSPQSLKVLNVLRVSASLPVNILIIGEKGTGKETLVNSVFANIAKYDPLELEEGLIPEEKEFFVRDFEKINDAISFMNRFKGYRIVAATTKPKKVLEEFFPIRLTIPPLRERKEDLEELKKLYIQKVKKEFELEELPRDFEVDLSKNAISLKRSIYEKALLEKMDEERFKQMCEEFFYPRLEKGYKKLIEFFEIPLLKAAKRKYKSALAISKALGMNRATLTGRLKKYNLSDKR